MSVNPGYAGQKLIPSALQKTSELRSYLDMHDMQHVPIEIDGNVSWENIPDMVASGAEILVTGTSSVFSRNYLREEALARFNALLEGLQ
jgi:pentose-5-phosphate-3-epimerase